MQIEHCLWRHPELEWLTRVQVGWLLGVHKNKVGAIAPPNRQLDQKNNRGKCRLWNWDTVMLMSERLTLKQQETNSITILG